MAKGTSEKRLHIEKANATMVIIVAVSAFIVVFSLLASRSLIDKRSYQNRVIAEKKIALNQLQENNKAAIQLVDSYKVFVSNPKNIIGGSPDGKGDKDGDNAQIVLDALPSKYDFPALASGLEKMLTTDGQGFELVSIAGVDDELNQSKQAATGTPQPVPMPFQVGVSGDFNSIEDFLDLMQRSIRPMNIQQISLTGSDEKLNASVTAQSYYQPSKSISITTKVVE